MRLLFGLKLNPYNVYPAAAVLTVPTKNPVPCSGSILGTLQIALLLLSFKAAGVL
jgi:hypothetical protein